MDEILIVEANNAAVTVTDDGLGAVLSLWTDNPKARVIQVSLDRWLLERTCLHAAQELERKPKPARGQS